jgi:hypothetical protein
MGNGQARFKSTRAKRTSTLQFNPTLYGRGIFFTVPSCFAGDQMIHAGFGKWWVSVMYIQRVELDEFSYDMSQGTSCGTMRLTTQDGTVVLHCVTRHAADASRQDVLKLMLDHAIAQLKRMPEYRTGQREITVAKDALHDQAKPTSNKA